MTHTNIRVYLEDDGVNINQVAYQAAAQVLADQRVNVEGVAAVPGNYNFSVTDSDAALGALTDAGYEAEARPTDMVRPQNRPGAFAALLQDYVEHGNPLAVIYSATDGEVALG
jgi:hypothetical protein